MPNLQVGNSLHEDNLHYKTKTPPRNQINRYHAEENLTTTP